MERLTLALGSEITVTLLTLPMITDGGRNVEAVCSVPDFGDDDMIVGLNHCPVDILASCRPGTVLLMKTYPLTDKFVDYSIVTPGAEIAAVDSL